MGLALLCELGGLLEHLLADNWLDTDPAFRRQRVEGLAGFCFRIHPQI